MNRARNFLGNVLKFFLLGTLLVTLILVFKTLIPSQPLAPQPTYISSSPAYPPPDKQSTSMPYPPPVETSPSPAITMTQTLSDFPPTRTPIPITPFPTLTLRPGPSPTLIPIISPAKDSAGSLSFVAKSSKDASSKLYAVSMDATGKSKGEPAMLTADDIQSDGFIFPSPDGNRLAITGSWGGLWMFNLKNNFSEKIILPFGPGSILFNWFPDNRRILKGGDTLVLVDPITNEYTTLIIPGYGRIIGAAASPDGQYVVYSYSEDSYHEPGLWIVNTNGQNAHLLLKDNYSVSNIAWSPNGKKIAFWGDGWEVIDADGSNIHQLASGIIAPQCYLLPPLWSPDSLALAVVTSQTGNAFCNGWGDGIFNGTNIMLIDVEKGKFRPLLNDSSTGNIDPTWSPDGSQIAFVSNRSGSAEVWVINTDGSNLRQLTQNNALVRYPYWRRAEP